MGRVRFADWVAGAGGAALLASLFLHWYGVEVLVTGGPPLSAEATAWQAFAVLDVVLAALALGPFALVVAQATRPSPTLPVALSVLATVGGMLATLLVLYRIVNQPGPNDAVDVQAGAWLALLAAVILTVGAWRSMRDERMPGAALPEIERLPAPAP